MTGCSWETCPDPAVAEQALLDDVDRITEAKFRPLCEHHLDVVVGLPYLQGVRSVSVDSVAVVRALAKDDQ